MTRGTVPPPETVIANLRASNAVLRAALQERRPSWRCLILGGVICGLGGFAVGAAFANPLSISGSMGTLSPSDEPGVVAVITFENVALNGSADDGPYTVAMPGLSVDLSFTWESGHMTGADRITVYPPDGMRCEPVSCVAEALEGQSATVRLLDWIGS